MKTCRNVQGEIKKETRETMYQRSREIISKRLIDVGNCKYTRYILLPLHVLTKNTNARFCWHSFHPHPAPMIVDRRTCCTHMIRACKTASFRHGLSNIAVYSIIVQRNRAGDHVFYPRVSYIRVLESNA